MIRKTKDRVHYTLLLIAALCIIIPGMKKQAIERVKVKKYITRPITCDTLLKCTQINDSTIIVVKSNGWDTASLYKFRKL